MYKSRSDTAGRALTSDPQLTHVTDCVIGDLFNHTTTRMDRIWIYRHNYVDSIKYNLTIGTTAPAEHLRGSDMFVESPTFTTVATERLSSIMSWIAPLNFPAKLRVSGESSGPPCLGFTARRPPRFFVFLLQFIPIEKWRKVQKLDTPRVEEYLLQTHQVSLHTRPSCGADRNFFQKY